MFKPKEPSQSEYEFVSIDELEPDDNLLRLIDNYIDFSFLLEKVRPYYSCDNGRPANPLILLKMMIIGCIYGIRFKTSTRKGNKNKRCLPLVFRFEIQGPCASLLND